jgi:hypothetical protein
MYKLDVTEKELEMLFSCLQFCRGAARNAQKYVNERETDISAFLAKLTMLESK